MKFLVYFHDYFFYGASKDVPTRSELPIDAVRKAIVNAVCHRDYTSNVGQI